MKKSLYILLAFAAVAMTVTGCSKKKGGGGAAAYPPGACYTNTVGYHGYPTNTNIGYQRIGGVCMDTRTYTAAPAQYCDNVNFQNGGYNGCDYVGNNMYWNGGINGAYNACSVYNNLFQVYYPVYIGALGIAVCVGQSTYSTFMTWGTPAFYPGYNNVIQGCVVSNNDPRCRGFGGTLGFYGGVQLGVYY